ncbi:CDGSH iron-sulfur domain-containing protein [Rhodohalobacter sp. 8-1]|uniref:CDGSH iron-sulfur domain-containing protein n=1 Tax=Rhodohalobacter sp. 8-1 TaxID=3131972 RepID=UPI0030EF7A31
MKEKILTYEGDDITVTYDLKRCIHAANCVDGLPKVFNPDRKPWIDADKAQGNAIADVIETCPTGALQYTMKQSDRIETPPSHNRISLQKDGPVYIFGDIEVQDHDGNTVLEDTRFAFCRCGASANKPACDNSHNEMKFQAGTKADPSKLPEPKAKGDKLVIKLMQNGPAILGGTYTMESDSMEPITSDKGVALCRCGASGTKPFCDGSHKEVGFEG